MFSYFILFLISGFCGILYELIWLRVAMAQFGVNTALVSIVLSTFMAGLGVGSLGAGWLIRRFEERINFPPLRLYAVTEFLIACSALAVPVELAAGHYLLAHKVGTTTFSSAEYYIFSGTWIALVLVPWCACMGATIPLGMFAIQRDPRLQTRRSFSFLYVSNLLGAALGGVLPLLSIELRGFRSTLHLGALLNCAVAISAFLLTFVQARPSPYLPVTTRAMHPPNPHKPILLLLFMTGLASMGMEVVWIRMLTPFINVMVYSFATILVVYLVATFVGSRIYRNSPRISEPERAGIWASLIFLSILPVLLCDPDIRVAGVFRVLVGIAPFSGLVGYLTPRLIDKWSAGDPGRAARAYAVNVLGCILGPLLSGFVLLPRLSQAWALLLFSLSWVAVPWSGALKKENTGTDGKRATLVFTILTVVLFLSCRSFENTFHTRQVLRDNTASVLATGDGMGKQLLVNGIGLAKLTPITKVMAHLPLAFLKQPPQKTLVICFGMGTTYRSLLSWNISSTAVDLVPSVPKLFWYYHADAPELLRSPLSHVVIDDGRRFLERTSEQYDLITIDPPPPVEAAGSSLLYSKQFYGEARRHLRQGGILQQWLPRVDAVVRSSVGKAVEESFAHVRVFRSVNGIGYHLLASDAPFPNRDGQELAARLPASAARDFVEWGPAPTAAGQFEILLQNELSLKQMIADAPDAPALDDDRPTNEYFAWRTIYSRWNQLRVNWPR